MCGYSLFTLYFQIHHQFFFTLNASIAWVSLKVTLLLLIPCTVLQHIIYVSEKKRGFFLRLCTFVCALKQASLHTVQSLSVWAAFISPISISITSISTILPPSFQPNYMDTENPMWGWNQCCHHLQTITADAQRWVNHGRGVSLPPERDIEEPVVVIHGSFCFYLHAWSSSSVYNEHQQHKCAFSLFFF